MLGWRRRKDGFEWREYVRTTILVRRKKRRDRLVQAGGAAVEGLKAAGERGAAAGAAGAQALGQAAKVAGHHGMVMGAAGAQALGRGAKVAGRRGLVIGAMSAQALGRGAVAAGHHSARAGGALARAVARAMRAGLPKVWAALQVTGRAIASGLVWLSTLLWAGTRGLARRIAPLVAACGRALQPALARLRQSSIFTPLAVVGAVALLGAGVRVGVKGADRDTLLALAIGAAIVMTLLIARYYDGAPPWLARSVLGVGNGLRGAASGLGALRLPSAQLLRPAAAVFALAIVAGVGWLAWRALPAGAWLARATGDHALVEGRAIALSGEMLRLAKTTVRIAGIEAPLPGQTCSSTRSRHSRCDAAARSALARLVSGTLVKCELQGEDRRGAQLGSCRVDEMDVAAELVRNGHVFAETGLFSAYGSLETDARAAKVGIWRGDAERPSVYRKQKWEEAKRDAPDGCPIKGDVKRGRRIYVLPWAKGYERVRIRLSRGERWFCSEAEARQAGWKPLEQS